MKNISIIPLSEKENALSLVWDVFLEFEAPDYSKEGVNEFYKSINNIEYLKMLSMYGAFINGNLVGVIATRSEGSHIALFFVNGKYHRQGIGRKLFEYVKDKCLTGKVTVNSSPYAVSIYKKLGFNPVDREQVINGIRFTPMEINI